MLQAKRADPPIRFDVCDQTFRRSLHTSLLLADLKSRDIWYKSVVKIRDPPRRDPDWGPLRDDHMESQMAISLRTVRWGSVHALLDRFDTLL